MSEEQRLERGDALWAALLTALVLLPVLFGLAYYPADIRYSHPLWYDGEHATRNYDLVDSYTLFYPNDRFFNEGLKLGQWRQWNPQILCGHPVLAAGGAGFLYPPRLLAHATLAPVTAHHLVLAIHLFLAGWGLARLARCLGLGTPGARLAATVWMLNGFMMTWFESEFSVVYGGLAPWILERLWVAFSPSRPRIAPALVASLLMGMLCLAGHTQFWANFMLVFGLWVLYLCARARSWRSLLFAVPVLLLPIALGSVYLWPILELAARTARPDRPFSYVVETYRHVVLSLLGTLLVPDLLGSPVGGFAIKFISVQGDWLMLESCAYLGVTALGLVFWSWQARHREHWRFLALMAGLLLVVPATALFYPAYLGIPGFSKMASTRLLFQLVMLWCLLAGFGIEALLQASPGHWRRSAQIVAGLALSLGAVAGMCGWSQRAQPHLWAKWATDLVQADRVRYPMVNFSSSVEAYPGDVLAAMKAFYHPGSLTWVGPILWLVATAAVLSWGASTSRRAWATWGLLAVAVADLGLFAARFNTLCRVEELDQRPPALAFLAEHLGHQRVLELATIRPNTGMIFGISTVGGQDALTSDRMVGLLNALNAGPGRGPFTQVVFPFRQATSPLVHVVGARYVLAYPQVDLSPLGFSLVFRQAPQGVAVWENPRAYPVVRMVSQVEVASDYSEALSKTIAAGDPRTVVLELGGEPARQGRSEEAPRVLGRSPGHWRLQATGPGWLVLSETFDPGWQAWVDGRPVDVVPADAAFQAIWLEAGTHQIAWSYAPPGQRAGAWVSGLALLLIGVGLALSRRAG